MAALRPLVAGNWKMNGLRASAAEFDKIIQGYADQRPQTDLAVCPPATLVAAFAERAARTAAAGKVYVGGQDCHAEPSGAFTGDIAAEMLADAGAAMVIVGHSERRTLHQETDGQVLAKARAVHRAGLIAIVCIGETREQREAGETLAVVRRQLDGSLPDAATATNLILAYEPVWAIGTGLTPTAEDVAEVHRDIRGRLAARYGSHGQAIRILYGGSVKPSNARELLAMANVDGALVGGASLKAEDFLGIAAAYA